MLVLPHTNLVPSHESYESNQVMRFMSHLVMHHVYVLNANGYDAAKSLCSPYEITIGMGDEDIYGRINRFGCGIVINSTLINHSCVPNVCRIFVKDSVVFKVIRPIRRGQELFLSYL